LPKKKKDNLISMAKKTNHASKYNTEALLKELIDSDVTSEYSKCLCIVSNEKRIAGGVNHKFNYFVAGFKSRIELLGVLDYIKALIISEFNE
jgi:hypothetical protein